jgi:tetratricopeptide (TPR) repeat protein
MAHKHSMEDANAMHPLDTTVNGTPMSVLLSQAVKLKSAQEQPLRKQFDAFPVFLQNSIFPRQETIDARAAPFEERFETATKLKMLGNKFAKDGNHVDSLNQYEMSLSVFKWIENSNPNWKNEGIKDGFVKQFFFQPSNASQKSRVLELMINVYNNIAIVSMKVEQFGNAVAACNSALLLDERNVKALFLRSKARCTPKSCGKTEEELAMKDLMSARRIDPKNTTIA